MFLKCLKDPARYHHKASESDRAGRGVAKQGGVCWGWGGVGGLLKLFCLQHDKSEVTQNHNVDDLIISHF